jgi:histidine ammonia-lyase
VIDSHRATATAAETTDAVMLNKALGLDDLWRVARGRARVELAPDALDAVARNRAAYERALAEGGPVYGVTTGLGALVNQPLPSAPATDVAASLLRSHAAGVGRELPRELVRAGLTARLRVLARAHSGVRPRLLHTIAALLNHDLVPRVPAGSLGPAGELSAPAHAFLVLIGEGDVGDADGNVVAAALGLEQIGLEPPALDAREALALISGTSFPAAIAGLAAVRAKRALDAADVAAALAFAALDGARPALAARVHALGHVPGQAIAAAHMRTLLAGGECQRDDRAGLQDPFSLRCAPQIHGAARAVHGFFESLVAGELDAVTDNPLVFEDPDEIVSAGAFHAQALASACDAMRAALADLAAVSERRTFRLLAPSINRGLPPFLSPHVGASGYMIVQYTAASLVAELRVLAHAVATESAVVSDNQEDHASNATLAASTLGEAVERAESVLAIELLCAAQALDLRGGAHRYGPGVRAAHALIRARVPALDHDRSPARDIAAIQELVVSGALSTLLAEVSAAEGQSGPG